MQHHTTKPAPVPQPVAALLADEGRSQSWLARKIGYSIFYTNRVLRGHLEPGADFRSAVAALLNRPESELFRAAGNGEMAEVA